MNHTHTFKTSFNSRADKITYDEREDLFVLHWNCKDSKPQNRHLPPHMQREKPCQAVKKQFYTVYSVNNGDEVIESFDSTPEWVTEIINILKTKAREKKAKHFVSKLSGKFFKVRVATADSEYTINLKQMNEKIDENGQSRI